MEPNVTVSVRADVGMMNVIVSANVNSCTCIRYDYDCERGTDYKCSASVNVRELCIHTHQRA